MGPAIPPYSDYGLAGLAEGGGTLLFIWLASTVFSAVSLLCLEPSQSLAYITTGCIVVAGISLTLFWAFMSGFGVIESSIGSAFLAFFFPIVPCSLMGGAMLTPWYHLFFRRKNQEKKNDDEEAATSTPVHNPAVEGMELSQAGPPHSPNEPHSSTDNAPSRWSQDTAREVGKKAWPFCLVILLCLVVIDVISHVLLVDTCFALNPDDMSTWASRTTAVSPCAPGDICHVYSLLGPNSSTLIVVGHYVAAAPNTDRHTPSAFVVTMCVIPTALQAPGVGTPICSSLSSTVLTRTATTTAADGGIVNDVLTVEDWRYIGRAAVHGLRPDTLYAVEVTMVTPAGNVTSVGKPYRVRTLPNSYATGKPISFLGGGDYESSGKGLTLLQNALSRTPNASFIFIGGDLTYSNNLRRCYRRWDNFFNSLRQLKRPADDGQFPMLTCVGNHEGGGYLHAKTKDQRLARYNHYFNFFPSVDYITKFSATDFAGMTEPSADVRADRTMTFQRLYIGSTAWLILDSGIMNSVDAQKAFATETLAAWSAQVKRTQTSGAVAGTSATSGEPLQAIVTMYHNPAFPVRRVFLDANSVEVRRVFLPLVTTYNVSLVLENHDHVYKRTKEILLRSSDGALSGSSLSTNSSSKRMGPVFVGDGSLGVFDTPVRATPDWYMERSASKDYATSGSLFPNGTIQLLAVDRDNVVFDTVVLPPPTMT